MGESYECSIYCLALFGALDLLFLVPGNRFYSLVSKQVDLVFVYLVLFLIGIFWLKEKSFANL